MMGAGIATVAAQAGIEVVLIDRDQAAADRGRAHVEAFLDDGVRNEAHHPGEEGRGPRPHHRDPRLRRPRRLRPRGRGGLRGPRGQGRGHPPGRGAARPRRHLRHQHLDPAHRRARQGQPRAGGLHRHPLLLAGGEDGAGRDHPRPGDRRPRRRQGARLRAADRQDPDRRQRRPLLLRQPLHHPLHQRGRPHGRRGRRAGADRERRPPARHAARPAAAGRRDLDRPRREDRQGDEGRAGRRLSREPRRRRALRPRRRRPPRPQGRSRLLRLRRQGQAPGPLARPPRALARPRPSSPRSSRCSTASR